MTGQTISHYRILEKLGEGGMGVVYKAEDTKLERTVALKFLAAHLLNDQEAKQRFLREAKSAAALHHPNICTVHEIDDVEGKTFLAMAFLEGEALDARIAKGPLPIQDALDIGRQVAEGLAAAHGKGIVHRDIKPANILVSPERRATIMDFGLARLTEASKLTRADQTVGTAAYMSPEQIQGTDVDHRTDIWALGCVLYEMVAGVGPFKGQYDQALAYEIVHEEPEPLTGVRAGLPMELEFIVGKCLSKGPADRYTRAEDIPVDLRKLAKDLESGRSRVQTPSLRADRDPPPHPPVRAWRGPWAMAAGALALGLAVGLVLPRSEPPPIQQAYDLEAPLPDNLQLHSLAFSPDGRTLVASLAGPEGQSLWLRRMDAAEFTEMPGTEGATYPFWSPDSRWVGFFADASLKKFPAEGGAAVTLCPAQDGRGGTWNRDGVIVFSPGPYTDDLQRVSESGGRVDNVGLPLDRLSGPRFPYFLPDGSKFLYTDESEGKAGIFVASLDGGQPANVLPDFSNPSYLSANESGEGSILFVRDGVLVEQRVDTKTLAAIGAPEPLAEPLAVTGNSDHYAFAISSSGALAFLRDRPLARSQLAWFERDGREIKRLGSPMGIRQIELSPDERLVALLDDVGGNIGVFEVGRELLSEVETAGLDAGGVAWAGNRTLSFGLKPVGGRVGIARARIGSAATAEALFTEDEQRRNPNPQDWSSDGRYLLFWTQSPAGDGDLWALAADGGEPFAVSASPSIEYSGAFSPDGNWVAVASDQRGRMEIYAQDFPAGNQRIRISSDGGNFPRWKSGGRELFYVALDGTLTVVPIQIQDEELTAGRPVGLFRTPTPPVLLIGRIKYDVAADGKSILLASPVGSERQSIRVRNSIRRQSDH